MINSLELGKKVIKDKIPLISRNPGVYKMISPLEEKFYILVKQKIYLIDLKATLLTQACQLEQRECYL